jgi:hypothetical protein
VHVCVCVYVYVIRRLSKRVSRVTRNLRVKLRKIQASWVQFLLILGAFEVRPMKIIHEYIQKQIFVFFGPSPR